MKEQSNMDEDIKQAMTAENIDNITAEPPSADEMLKFRKKLLELLIWCLMFSGAIGIVMPLFLNNTHKPAVYLYPEKTQKIEVKLDKSIKYFNVIPKYNNGWYVEASPDGSIKDLQPQYTECKKLPYKEFGFEYSKNACEMNKYPYIYWDGVQITKPLPDKKEGFLVKRADIDSFLNEKADTLKMNAAEKSEFMRYWSKKMHDKKWKYYRVYFLQNEEVNDYLPLYVNPKPDNAYRVQIIIRRGSADMQITEQELIPINRGGFTLVEWGGVIKR